MTRLEKLEQAVAALPEQEYDQFRCWFLERDWEKWDRQVEADAKAGKLDFLNQEGFQAKRESRVRDL